MSHPSTQCHQFLFPNLIVEMDMIAGHLYQVCKSRYVENILALSVILAKIVMNLFKGEKLLINQVS